MLKADARWDLMCEYVREWLRARVTDPGLARKQLDPSGKKPKLADPTWGAKTALAQELGISHSTVIGTTSTTNPRGIGPELVTAVANRLGWSLSRLEVEALRKAGRGDVAEATLAELGVAPSSPLPSPPPEDPWLAVEESALFAEAPAQVQAAFRDPRRRMPLPSQRHRALGRATQLLLSLWEDFHEGILDVEGPPSQHDDGGTSGVRLNAVHQARERLRRRGGQQ